MLKVLHDDRQELIQQHKQAIIKLKENLLEKFQKEFDEKLTDAMAKFQIELIENRVQLEIQEKEYLRQIENIKQEADKKLKYIYSYWNGWEYHTTIIY